MKSENRAGKIVNIYIICFSFHSHKYHSRYTQNVLFLMPSISLALIKNNIFRRSQRWFLAILVVLPSLRLKSVPLTLDTMDIDEAEASADSLCCVLQ